MVNNRVGVYSDGSPTNPDAPVRFRNNLFAYNEIGDGAAAQHPAQRVHGQYLPGQQRPDRRGRRGDVLRNDWAVAGRGNYWSDYAGYDADGDQVGDLPYQSKSLFEDLLGSHPELRLFQLGPATDALDLAARAFPVFEPHVKMADPHPLTAPPALPAVPGMPAAAGGRQLRRRAGDDRPGRAAPAGWPASALELSQLSSARRAARRRPAAGEHP